MITALHSLSGLYKEKGSLEATYRQSDANEISPLFIEFSKDVSWGSKRKKSQSFSKISDGEI